MLTPITGNLPVWIAAVGDIWGAECRVREEVGRAGIVLLVKSALALLAGVGGEVLARKYIFQKRVMEKAVLLKDSIGYSVDDSLEEEFYSRSASVIGSDLARYSEEHDDMIKKK